MAKKPKIKAVSSISTPEPPADYVIIEKVKGVTYVYTESAEHHANVQPTRLKESIRLHNDMLRHECNFDAYGQNVHFVFKLA